jgi:uncharacterized protein YbdZ (MbtH family)
MEGYIVVVNHEDFYSYWRADLDPPLGWKPAGFSGSKEACLDWIEKVWIDQRPRSLRERMAKREQKSPTPVPPEHSDEPDLVKQLCEGTHPVRCELFGGRLDDRVAANFIHLHFPETQGGTTVAVQITESEWSGVALRLTGIFTLDFVRLSCNVRIDSERLVGTGRVERAPESRPLPRTIPD